MIEYGLNDTIRMILVLYSFTPSEPSDMIFQTMLMLKAILAKLLSQKAGQLES